MKNRPKLRELAYMLGVYSQKTIPQTYINELSNYELLLTILSKVNEIIERCGKYDEVINEVINYLDTLDDAVIEYLDELKESGYIAEQIKEVVSASRKILFVGDSYTFGSGLANPATESFPELINSIGISSVRTASAGGGFIAIGNNGTFLDLINNFNTNPESFTDVFILGGINDTYQNLDLLGTAIENTINTAHQKFTNATIHVGYISQTHRLADGGCNYENTMRVKQAYKEHSLGAKCCYINNAEYMLKQIGVLQTDGLHPTAVGHRLIANYLISYILGGNLSVTRWANGILLNYNAQVTSGAFNINQTVVNNLCTLNQPTNSVYVVNNVGMELNGNSSVVVGDMIGGIAFGQADGLNQFGCVNHIVSGSVTYSTTESGESITETMPISIRIVGTTIFFAPLKLSSASAFTFGYIRQINLPPWSITIPSDMI